jgi:RimJ/RimL family protein N-acetyltransferase
MFPDLVRDDVFRLETRRLWLRWPRAADAGALAREAAHRDVAEKALDLRHPLPEGAAAEFILTARKSNAQGEGLALVLARKCAPTEAVGCIASKPASKLAGDGDAARLSFWLARGFWGQGLMSEAVRAFADLLFGFTSAAELEADVAGLNPVALHVLARAGFVPGGSQSDSPPGRQPVERFRLERSRWSRDYGRRAADAQNAMSVRRTAGNRA